MAKISRKWAVLAAFSISVSSIAGTSTVYASSSSPETLTWFSDVNWWTMSQWNSDPNTVDGAITKKTGLSFNFDVPAQDADTKLNLMMVAGQLPDVMSLQDYTTVEQLVKAGKVWSMTDLMKKYDPSFLKTFPKDLETLQVQQFGGFYGIPSYATSTDLVKEYPRAKSLMENTDNHEIVFNQSIMKEAGIKLSDLKTEAGLLAALKKVTNMHLKYKGAAVVPLQIDNKDAWTGSVDLLAQMFGGMPVDKKGNFRPLMLSPEEKSAIDFLNQAAQMGALKKNELTMDETATNAVGQSGRVFCFLGNIANPHFDTLYNNTKITTVSPGNVISNTHYTPISGYGDYAGWTFTLVSKTAKDPAAIAKWIAFMWSPQGQLLNNYGFQKTDWNYDKHGYVIPTQTYNNIFKKDPNTWETTGLTAFWFMNNQGFLDQVTPPPTAMPQTMMLKLQEAHPTTKPVHRYDDTALTMPADLIPPGSALYEDQQNITQYWQTQLASMIFAPSADAENQIYQQTMAQLPKMGLTKIDSLENQQFHKQEKSLGEHIIGVNP